MHAEAAGWEIILSSGSLHKSWGAWFISNQPFLLRDQVSFYCSLFLVLSASVMRDVLSPPSASFIHSLSLSLSLSASLWFPCSLHPSPPVSLSLSVLNPLFFPLGVWILWVCRSFFQLQSVTCALLKNRVPIVKYRGGSSFLMCVFFLIKSGMKHQKMWGEGECASVSFYRKRFMFLPAETFHTTCDSLVHLSVWKHWRVRQCRKPQPGWVFSTQTIRGIWSKHTDYQTHVWF